MNSDEFYEKWVVKCWDDGEDKKEYFFNSIIDAQNKFEDKFLHFENVELYHYKVNVAQRLWQSK